MGRRGPPPKPSKLKELQGTYRPDRAPAKEMAPPPGTPERPKWLDRRARAEWDRVVPQLVACGILCDVDRAGLANYCAAVSLAERATRQYQKDGLMVAGPQEGVKVKHPMIQVAKEARAQARLLGAEFGLTASSRSRISEPDWKPGGRAAAAGTAGAPPGPPKDSAEAFLFPTVSAGGASGPSKG
jgi:P27 family predicted phage terminase small subunit